MYTNERNLETERGSFKEAESMGEECSRIVYATYRGWRDVTRRGEEEEGAPGWALKL